MKNTLLVILFSFGFIGSSYANKDVANSAIRCSALIYIEINRPEMGGLAAGEVLMKRVYAYHTIDGSDIEMTNGQINTAQKDALLELSQEYVDGSGLAQEYRHCIYWMTDVAKYINISEYDYPDKHTEESAAEEMALFLSAPTRSSITTFKNPIETWEQQVDLGFASWASQDGSIPLEKEILNKIKKLSEKTR